MIRYGMTIDPHSPIEDIALDLARGLATKYPDWEIANAKSVYDIFCDRVIISAEASYLGHYAFRVLFYADDTWDEVKGCFDEARERWEQKHAGA